MNFLLTFPTLSSVNFCDFVIVAETYFLKTYWNKDEKYGKSDGVQNYIETDFFFF